MTIYKKAKKMMQPNEIDSHQSDLYLLKNDISEQLINEYEFKTNVKTFFSQIDKKMWFDVPFAYDPYWDKHLIHL